MLQIITETSTKERFNEAFKKRLRSKMKENFQDYDGEHIFVKSNLKKRKIYIKDIKWIEALGDYVKLITKEKALYSIYHESF